MDRIDVKSIIQTSLQNVLSQDDIVVTEATAAKDIDGWDSLANVRLFIDIENQVGLRFNPSDLDGLKSVGDITDMILEKLST